MGELGRKVLTAPTIQIEHKLEMCGDGLGISEENQKGNQKAGNRTLRG